jgi:secretion/DNA translocation related TadE-like protein
MTPGVSLSKRPSRSLPWSSSSACVYRGSPRPRCRCVASMPHVRPLASPGGATTARLPLRRNELPPTAQRCGCGVTANWWSQPSVRGRRSCRALPSQPKRWPRSNQDDRGSATLVAVAVMAVLLALTLGGVAVGSAVIARHRAQAAADLAALAAAAHLADGAGEACSHAAALVHAMRTVLTQCAVEDLDVVVAVDASVVFGRMGVGPARASARAGPVEARS